MGIIGSYLGKKIVVFIPQDIFKKMVLVAIGIASVILIIGGLKIV
jgi:uncharacterized protein